MNLPFIGVIAGSTFGCLIGLGFARAGMQEFSKVYSRRKQILRIKGTVLTVMKKREYRPGSGNEPGRYHVTFLPYIAFTKPDGTQERFHSESGASLPVRKKFGGGSIEPESPWQDGQEIEIFFDPGGVIKPCLADRFSLYGIAIGFIISGIIIMAMALVVGTVLGKKMLREGGH